MLRKLIQAGAVLALCTGPFAGLAAAEQRCYPDPTICGGRSTEEEIKRQKAADQAYDGAIKKIPDKKSSADPWGNIRPSTPGASKNKQP